MLCAHSFSVDEKTIRGKGPGHEVHQISNKAQSVKLNDMREPCAQECVDNLLMGSAPRGEQSHMLEALASSAAGRNR